MLKPGSLVLLRNSARDGRKGDKFQACYLGPYEIAKHLGKNVFRLRNPTTGLLLKKSVNGCRLKLYHKRQWPPLHLSNTSLSQVNTFFLIFYWHLGWYKLSCLELHTFLSLLSVSDWISWLNLEQHKAKWETTTSCRI